MPFDGMPYPLLRSGSDSYVAVNTRTLPRYMRPKFSHPLATMSGDISTSQARPLLPSFYLNQSAVCVL